MGGRGRVKRKAVQSSDGWTVITHGLSGLSLDKGKVENTGSMPDVVKGLTAETLTSDLKARQGRWNDTECVRQVRDLLAKRTWDVKQAVCIGIGSFSRDWEHRHRSMWQLVLFVDVVEYLRKHNPEIELHAQEPAFTDIDTSFLSTLGVKVTDTGLETHISAHTFVFSPFIDWYLLLPTFLKDRDPELYVGNEVLDDYTAYAKTEDKRGKLEECNELGKTFLENREVQKVKEFELHAHALNGMVVYWKKEVEGKDDTVAEDAPS